MSLLFCWVMISVLFLVFLALGCGFESSPHGFVSTHRLFNYSICYVRLMMGLFFACLFLPRWDVFLCFLLAIWFLERHRVFSKLLRIGRCFLDPLFHAGHLGPPSFAALRDAISPLLRCAVCRIGIVFILPLAADRHSVLGISPDGM